MTKKDPRNITVSIGPDEPLRAFLKKKAQHYRTTPNLYLAMVAQALFLYEEHDDPSMMYLFPHPPVSDEQVERITALVEKTMLSLGQAGLVLQADTPPESPKEVVDEDALDSFLDGL